VTTLNPWARRVVGERERAETGDRSGGRDDVVGPPATWFAVAVTFVLLRSLVTARLESAVRRTLPGGGTDVWPETPLAVLIGDVTCNGVVKATSDTSPTAAVPAVAAMFFATSGVFSA